MKKILSVLLAALLALGCFGAIAFAEDDGEIGYTASYAVYVSPWNQGQIQIVPAEGYGSEVKRGDNYKFTIETYNGYEFDQTTCVKIYPAKTFAPDMVLTNLDAGYGVTITPDADGVYTIDAVEEDLVVAVFNLTEGSMPAIRTFLFDMFNFFLRLFQWFFGLKKDV